MGEGGLQETPPVLPCDGRELDHVEAPPLQLAIASGNNGALLDQVFPAQTVREAARLGLGDGQIKDCLG